MSQGIDREFSLIQKNEDGSCIIKYFFRSGELGSIEYRNPRGYLHRNDGPAYVCYNIDGSIHHEAYMLNGRYHRLDGPADTLNTCGGVYYFILGFDVSEEDFNTPGFIDAFILEHS